MNRTLRSILEVLDAKDSSEMTLAEMINVLCLNPERFKLTEKSDELGVQSFWLKRGRK